VPFVDALSCNVNATWNDGTFPRYLLDTLHALSGKPLIIGEFYVAARENRSGNRNTHGAFPVVTTQKERSSSFRNTVQSLLGIPYVIGADWFQFYDEPTHGRFDGENFNFGLVDIHDSPYEGITSAAAALDRHRVKRQTPRSPLSAPHGVPPAPSKPLDGFEPTLALKHWDRERGFLEPASKFPLADLYVCWDENAIYLGLCAQDVVEDVFYRGKTVLAIDRAEWVVRTWIDDSEKTIRGRIGSAMEPVFDEPFVQVRNLSGINGNVRNIAALELPARLFGKSRFKAGDELKLGSTYLTHCRAYRVEWESTLALRAE
jgi:hypothetical protein